MYQYSQTLNNVGSIVAKVLENLGCVSLVNLQERWLVLCFLPLLIFFLAEFSLESEICMLFDLLLDDFLRDRIMGDYINQMKLGSPYGWVDAGLFQSFDFGSGKRLYDFVVVYQFVCCFR